jgi:PAS domain S-box-containing protein
MNGVIDNKVPLSPDPAAISSGQAAKPAPPAQAAGSAGVEELEKRIVRERGLFRAIIDNLPDCLYVKDTQSRFLLNNLAHAQVLGAARPEDLAGKSDFDFSPEDQARHFKAEEEEIIRTGQPVLNRVRLRRDNTGEERWVSVSKVPWRDKSGKVLGVVGITRDVHDTRVAEEKLKLFAVQLERSNRELEDFAYVASHDLQEPLRKIIVFGDRLREKCGGQLPPETDDYLERMQKAAHRMQTLITDLLTFSRVTTKAQPFVPVDLAVIAREVVNDLEGRLEQVQGRVEVGPLPVINAEPLQMRQLLQNLIGNALKFHRPDEAPVVKVQAERVSLPGPGTDGDTAERDCHRLTVSDNGIGFDEKYLDRIFNVFQRLHGRGEYEGTGIGLAIARKIARHHGGEITAQSRPGQGATFVVTLPATPNP